MEQTERILTDQEKALLLEVVTSLQVSPKQPNAVEVMTLLKSIMTKLTPEAEEVEVVKE